MSRKGLKYSHSSYRKIEIIFQLPNNCQLVTAIDLKQEIEEFEEMKWDGLGDHGSLRFSVLRILAPLMTLYGCGGDGKP